jgi:hypothetical protein
MNTHTARVLLPLAVGALVALATLAAARRLTRRTTPAEVVETAEDRAHARRMFRLADIEGKGRGLVARRDVPAWTLVGPYPGRVYTYAQHGALKARGVCDDEYAVEFWDSRPGGRIGETVVLDPRVGGEFRYAGVTPFVNEPSASQRPNVVWVWNFPKHRIELWTSRALRAGDELTVCYGDAYERKYRTRCSEEGVEPARYALGYGARRPRDWYDVVSADDVAPGPPAA